MRAYVLVTVGSGKARDVARKILAMPWVKMANACWGDSDVYVVVEVPSGGDLNALVADKLPQLEGVARTSTHIVID